MGVNTLNTKALPHQLHLRLLLLLYLTQLLQLISQEEEMRLTLEQLTPAYSRVDNARTELSFTNSL